jgi:hypothetical protein
MVELEKRHAVKSYEHVIMILSRLANHSRVDRDEEAWAWLFHDYADVLKEFPLAIVQDVLIQHMRHMLWFPKIAELIQRCKAQYGKEREDLRRVRVLLGLEAPRSFERPIDGPIKPVPQRSPEEACALIETVKSKSGYRPVPMVGWSEQTARYQEATAEQKAERMANLSRRLERYAR